MPRLTSIHPGIRPGSALAGLALSLLTLTACSTDHQVAHRGLSPDGYGFVQNGPTLAPPDHLIQHQSQSPETHPTEARSTTPPAPATTQR